MRRREGWMDGWRCESNAFLEEDEKEGQNRKGEVRGRQAGRAGGDQGKRIEETRAPEFHYLVLGQSYNNLGAASFLAFAPTARPIRCRN